MPEKEEEEEEVQQHPHPHLPHQHQHPHGDPFTLPTLRHGIPLSRQRMTYPPSPPVTFPPIWVVVVESSSSFSLLHHHHYIRIRILYPPHRGHLRIIHHHHPTVDQPTPTTPPKIIAIIYSKIAGLTTAFHTIIIGHITIRIPIIVSTMYGDYSVL